MATVSVRYIVNDVDDAIAFYTERLGFTEQMHPAPTFAMLTRGDLRLVLSAPGGGPAPDAGRPPGGGGGPPPSPRAAARGATPPSAAARSRPPGDGLSC